MKGIASAPASSGNLGPGFDCVALALDMRCRVEVEPSDAWVIHQDGGSTFPGPEDLVLRSVATVAPGPHTIGIDNAIPRSRGLGSSSAVAAAAIGAAVRAAGGEPDPALVFRLVTDLEGHADNAAAAVYGGLVLTRPGVWRHLELWDGFHVVLAIPDGHLSTHEARAALPPTVDRAVVSRSLSRLGFLLEGLRTGSADVLGLASGDELHESPRATLSPITGRLMDLARAAGARHVAWSGAGPSVLALTTGEESAPVVEALEAGLAGDGKVLVIRPATSGLD